MAASSTAARAGLSIDDVVKMANWTSDNTFRRFYYKLIDNPAFGRTVLNITQTLN